MVIYVKKIYYLVIIMITALIFFSGCNNILKTKLIENKDYFIKGKFTGKYLDTTKRGYYIDTLNQPNAPYYYIICMGEKNSGGYGLEIKAVNKIDNTTEIIVKEITPKKDEIVTMAFTYPTVIVEFPEYQDNIIIKNTKGEEFIELDNY